jgi:protein gp37
MADNSSIEWTESTWNPVTGCDKISPGCKFCYAERMAKRLHKMGLPQYKNCFELTLQHSMLNLPYKWTKPRTIFVNSMSDLFHNDVPLEYIKDVFAVMNNTPIHTYQILTKREKRLEELAQLLNWTENIWMGVSIESQTFVKRINNLISVPAAVRFLSIEPLIGEISEIAKTSPKAFRAMGSRIDEIYGMLESMRREKNESDEERIRDQFRCVNCKSEKLVAIHVKCTNCGMENWMGWFPDSKVNKEKHF